MLGSVTAPPRCLFAQTAMSPGSGTDRAGPPRRNDHLVRNCCDVVDRPSTRAATTGIRGRSRPLLPLRPDGPPIHLVCAGRWTGTLRAAHAGRPSARLGRARALRRRRGGRRSGRQGRPRGAGPGERGQGRRPRRASPRRAGASAPPSRPVRAAARGAGWPRGQARSGSGSRPTAPRRASRRTGSLQGPRLHGVLALARPSTLR